MKKSDMKFLSKLLNYEKIVIQCHNFPDADALASALGVYAYLRAHKRNVRIIYGGPEPIKKRNLLYMIDFCNIPVNYVEYQAGTMLEDTDLILIVDGQFGAGNVIKYEAPNIAVIDHHVRMLEENDMYYIDNTYQSCSTIVWEMLVNEGFEINENKGLEIALSYGLYTDTGCYMDLYSEKDMAMKTALECKYDEFDILKKSNLTVAELMMVADAIQNVDIDIEHKYSINLVMNCNQIVLGIIGDMVIQVAGIDISFTYTETPTDYLFSIRTCGSISASTLAMKIGEGVGSGGGHMNKAAGRIEINKFNSLYSDMDFKTYVENMIKNR